MKNIPLIKRRASHIAALLALLSLVTSALHGQVKWNPGHYMQRGSNDHVQANRFAMYDEIGSNTAIKGVCVFFRWCQLEGNTPGDYSAGIALVQSEINYLKSLPVPKRLFIRVNDCYYGGSPSLPRSDYFPTYLYDQGALFTTSNGVHWKKWNATYMDYMIQMIQAYGAAFDSEPYFEGIAPLRETGISGSPKPADYSASALLTQFNRLALATKQAFPTSNVVMPANYVADTQSNTNSHIAYLASIGVGVENPDTCPDCAIFSDKTIRGESGGVDYRGVIPIFYGVEVSELGYDAVGPDGGYTPTQLYNWVNGTQRGSHMFWDHNTFVGTAEQRWETGILPFINAHSTFTYSGLPSVYQTVPAAPSGLAATPVSSSQINLGWTDNANNETAFEVDRATNSSFSAGLVTNTLPPNANATSFNSTGLAANTTYYYRVRATNSFGDSANSNVTSATTLSALPGGWQNQDVGSVGVAGSTTYSSGTYTVKGAGSNIWDTADSFQFAQQALNGDGWIIARVASIQNTNGNAKAGVMIRETLAANSKHVLLNLTPSYGTSLLWRSATGGATSYATGGGAAPYWLKLVRASNTITGFISSNGTSWTQIGSPQTISMATSVYAGLAVVSMVNTTLNTSTFDNVSVVTNGVPNITTTSLANANPGSAYSQTLAASGGNGTLTWSLASGSLPAGLSLSAAGVISGTPTASGTSSFTVRVADGDDITGATDEDTQALGITVGLPSPWQNQDIGSVGVAGSSSYSSGTMTVAGAGSNIWDAADSFQYAYQTMTGDGSIVARVATVQNTNGNAKAGIMIRESLAADSKHVLLNLTPAYGTSMIWRSATAGTSSYSTGGGTAPYWLRLVRAGNTFTASVSSNGSTWTQVGSPVTITMASSVKVGLAVVSLVNTTLNTSTFDNLTITP